MNRVDRITPREKQIEYYSDFLIDLDRNPISGELARVSNERAVIRAMKYLLLTNKGERPYDSSIGSGIKRLLFEPMDEVTTDILRQTIERTIEQHEPRVQLMQVEVLPNEQQDLYQVGITFAMVNAPSEVFSFSTVLKRVR